ncbi:MAG: ankyrin repeat domain-containing protein [Candidatus Nucleicultricaceae bacterium]
MMHLKLRTALLAVLGLGFLSASNVLFAKGAETAVAAEKPEVETAHAAGPEHETGSEHEAEAAHGTPAHAAEEPTAHAPEAAHPQAQEATPQEATAPKREVPFTEMRSALKKGKADLEKLIQEGGNVNALDAHSGLALVHEAAAEGNVQRLQILKDAGANLDEPNKLGMTALHLATTTGHNNAVQKLVELGVKTDAKNAQQKTAYDLAKARGNKPVMDILESHPH